MIFCLLIIITTFPDIFLNTSATPININSGFLLRGIDLHATKLSKDAQLLLFDIFVTYNFLTSSAIAFRRSDVPVPKHVETIILRYPSASILMVPNFLLLLLLLSLLVLHQCHRTQLDASLVLVPVVSPVGSCLFHQDAIKLITDCFLK